MQDELNNTTMEMHGRKLCNNKDYNKLTNQSIELFNRVKEGLTDEKKELLFEYEEIVSVIQNMAVAEAYNMGKVAGHKMSISLSEPA